jgi:hypothetical protein
MGSAKAVGSRQAPTPASRVAVREHRRRALQRRSGSGNRGEYDAAIRTRRAIRCAESSLVHELKGNFPVTGERCNPLTISDGVSRYLLTCKALRSTTCAPVLSSFDDFREFGVPEAIRTDNGTVFYAQRDP